VYSKLWRNWRDPWWKTFVSTSFSLTSWPGKSRIYYSIWYNLVIYFVHFDLLKKNSPASPLLRDYAAIVFFANNRFETGKKKLHYLTFQDFAFCAGQLISNWTVGALGESLINWPAVVHCNHSWGLH
jgi:hypothetical protein